MKNDKIKETWEEFINEYSQYFKDNETIWKDYLYMVKKYINDHHKFPYENKDDKDRISMSFNLDLESLSIEP